MPQKMGAAKWVVCFLLFAWSVSAVAQKSVDWSRLYQQARPAVVAVFSLKDSQRHRGTGFFIGNDGKAGRCRFAPTRYAPFCEARRRCFSQGRERAASRFATAVVFIESGSSAFACPADSETPHVESRRCYLHYQHPS